MARVRVLICDDAELYATMLESWFAADAELEVVGTAADEAQALAQAAALRPQVILLDHLFSGQDSPAMAPRLRELVPGVRIVLVSGLTRGPLEQAAAVIGAAAFVPKASGPESVREAILAAATPGPEGARPCSA